jgi:hypothetical protein
MVICFKFSSFVILYDFTMKYKRLFLVSFLFLFASTVVLAQRKHPLLIPCKQKLGFKHFITKTPWRVQLAWNLVDDDGRAYSHLFDVKNSWNFPPYPAKLAVEKELNNNWNLELAFAYNKYKAGKTINGDVLTSDKSIFSIDLNAKYILTKKYLVEPFLLAGLGYTNRSTVRYAQTGTFNLGIGATVWVLDNQLGINLQGTGKFGLDAPLKTLSNYLQHSIGVVYKFSGNNKRLKAARISLKRIYMK